MRTLLLYTTQGCHLCELAAQLLAQLDSRLFRVEPVEISDEDALIERYGVRIPVVADQGSGAELGWPFDGEQLVAFLGRLPASV